MEHVFVETNWLVACLAPAHHKLSEALELLDKARGGQITLHVPAICIAECQRPIRDKFQVKVEADRVRKFLVWARGEGVVETQQEKAVLRTLDQMEGLVKRDLDRLADSLHQLCAEAGVEVFHMEEAMWLRITELSRMAIQLQPFDLAILASILVKAEMLRGQGADRIAFCEADADLQPWDKTGGEKQPLVKLFDEARIWVYGDFLMQTPVRPANWPNVLD